jgi:hypothetical protein
VQDQDEQRQPPERQRAAVAGRGAVREAILDVELADQILAGPPGVAGQRIRRRDVRDRGAVAVGRGESS